MQEKCKNREMRYQSPLVYEWTSITKAQLYEWVAYTQNVQKTSHLEADLVLEGSSDPAEHCAHHTLLSPRQSQRDIVLASSVRTSVHPSGTISL